MASAQVEVPEELEDGIDTMEMALRMSSMRAASPAEAEPPTTLSTPRSADEPQVEEAAPSAEPEPIITAQPAAPEMEPTAQAASTRLAPEMEPMAAQWAPTPIAAPEMEPTAGQWAPTPVATAPQMPPPMEPQAAFQAAPPVRRHSLSSAVPLAAQGFSMRMVSQPEVRVAQAMPKAGAGPASVVYRVAPAKVQTSQPMRAAPAGSPTLLNAMGGAVPTAATTHCLGTATVVQRSATLGYSA